jgi:hypothetical protein
MEVDGMAFDATGSAQPIGHPERAEPLQFESGCPTPETTQHPAVV